MWRMYIEGEYTLPIFTAIVFSPIDGFLTARQIKQTDIGILNMYISLTFWGARGGGGGWGGWGGVKF